MAHSYSALYYPFIHFKDDAWLKVAALYWDRMGRIVPQTYQTEDSDTVHELGDFVETLRPEWVRPQLGETFVQFIDEYGERLRERYALHLRGNWQPVPISERPPTAGGPSGSDPRLGYVFYEKISDDVSYALRTSGIAAPDEYDPRWIGMHPRLTAVYMTALTAELARERGMYPLTNETLNYVAVSGWTIERLAQALLGDVQLVGAKRGDREVESMAAYMALQTALPEDPANLPVDRILKFREKYPGERARFQKFITDFVETREWLSEVSNRDVLEKRLQDEYEKELKPQIGEFRERLRDVDIATVTGALAIQMSVPSVLSTVPINPVGGLLAGAALALVPIFLDRRKAQREQKSSPTAYLMRLEKDLKPQQLTNWIRERSRQFRPAAS